LPRGSQGPPGPGFVRNQTGPCNVVVGRKRLFLQDLVLIRCRRCTRERLWPFSGFFQRNAPSGVANHQRPEPPRFRTRCGNGAQLVLQYRPRFCLSAMERVMRSRLFQVALITGGVVAGAVLAYSLRQGDVNINYTGFQQLKKGMCEKEGLCEEEVEAIL